MVRKREQLSVNNNYLKMDRCISILIHVRTVIFEAIKKENPGLLPFDWLMVQLYPEKTMKKDLFSFVFEKCYNQAPGRHECLEEPSREIWRKWRERVALVRDGGRRSSGPSEWAHGFFSFAEKLRNRGLLSLRCSKEWSIFLKWLEQKRAIHWWPVHGCRSSISRKRPQVRSLRNDRIHFVRTGALSSRWSNVHIYRCCDNIVTQLALVM